MGHVNTEIDSENNLIIQTVSGELTMSDITSAINKAISNHQFRSGMNVLWDLSDATLLNAEVSDIHQVIKFIRYHLVRRGTGFKLAIVATGKLEYGLARMYEAYGENLPFDKKVFYDYHEAYRWINF